MLKIVIKNNDVLSSQLNDEIGSHVAEVYNTRDGICIELDSTTNKNTEIVIDKSIAQVKSQHYPELVDYCLAHFKSIDDLDFQIACLMKKHGCRSEVALYDVLCSFRRSYD